MFKFLKHPITIVLLFLGIGGYVWADYDVTHGSGTTIFAFACFALPKVCPAHVNINSAGTEVGTVANPIHTSATATSLQPVNGTVTANQGAAGTAPWPVTIGNTPATSIPVTPTTTDASNLSTKFLALDTTLTPVKDAMIAQAAATAAKKGPMVQCAVTTLAPGYTTATVDPLSCDPAGNLRVNVVTATGVSQNSPTASQTGSVIMGTTKTTALPTYGDSQSNILTTNTNGGLYVTPSSGTLGGATGYHSYSAATTNSTNVKASAGTVYTLSLQSVTAGPTVYYFKFYDKATAPTCASDAVIWATAVSSLASGYNTTIPFPTGLSFANGVGFCITGAQADADNSAAATGITVSIAYR